HFPTLRELANADAALRRELQQPGEVNEHGAIADSAKRARYTELAPYVNLAFNIARFEEIRLLFDNLCLKLAIGLPFVAIGFGVFAWAANPPKKEAAAQSPQHVRPLAGGGRMTEPMPRGVAPRPADQPLARWAQLIPPDSACGSLLTSAKTSTAKLGDCAPKLLVRVIFPGSHDATTW